MAYLTIKKRSLISNRWNSRSVRYLKIVRVGFALLLLIRQEMKYSNLHSLQRNVSFYLCVTYCDKDMHAIIVFDANYNFWPNNVCCAHVIATLFKHCSGDDPATN